MNRSIKSITIALALVTGGNAVGEEAEWDLLHQMRVSVPSGLSTSGDIHFGTSAEYTQIRVTLEADGGACEVSTTTLYATHHPNQRVYSNYLPNSEGDFDINDNDGGRPIDWLRVDNFNPRIFPGACLRSIYGKRAGVRPDNFRYSGRIRYNGGLRDDILSPVASDKRVVEFWLRIPAYCNRVEVLEAGTITEDVYDPALLIDEDNKIFEVNDGSGSRVSDIAAILNGPRDLDCDIAVYIKTRD